MKSYLEYLPNGLPAGIFLVIFNPIFLGEEKTVNINIDYSAKLNLGYFILIILSFIGPLNFCYTRIYRDSLPIALPSTNGELLESMINIHKNSTSEKILKHLVTKWSHL